MACDGPHRIFTTDPIYQDLERGQGSHRRTQIRRGPLPTHRTINFELAVSYIRHASGHTTHLRCESSEASPRVPSSLVPSLYTHTKRRCVHGPKCDCRTERTNSPWNSLPFRKSWDKLARSPSSLGNWPAKQVKCQRTYNACMLEHTTRLQLSCWRR